MSAIVIEHAETDEQRAERERVTARLKSMFRGMAEAAVETAGATCGHPSTRRDERGRCMACAELDADAGELLL